MLAFVIYLCILLFQASVFSQAVIDPKVSEDLRDGNSATVILEFQPTSEHVALHRNQNERASPNEDYETLVHDLMSASTALQASAVALITSPQMAARNSGEPTKYKPIQLWTKNELIIKNADLRLVEALAKLPTIKKIRADEQLPPPSLPPSAEGRQNDDENKNPYTYWNIDMMHIREAWAQGANGNGVVVGIIDSGAYYKHELLVTKWRREYGWYDPVNGAQYPEDDRWDSHGTAAASIIVAGESRQHSKAGPIGVAPGAKFIACRWFTNSSLPRFSIDMCVQFMACPTDWQGKNPNCAMRPRIVNHSFGSSIVATDIQLYIKAGITLTQSAGNSGNGVHCYKLNLEAQLDYPIVVAAIDKHRRLPHFSSVGPTSDNRTKPDVVAPGDFVQVCFNQKNKNYYGWGFYGLRSGSSYAAPAVAGVAALMLSVNPSLTSKDIKKIIQIYAIWNVNQTITCGNIGKNIRPNGVAGWGIVNAEHSVKAAKKTGCTNTVLRASTLLDDDLQNEYYDR